MSKKENNFTESPEGALKAVQSGDVNSLKELLAREHRKRMPGAAASKISGRKCWHGFSNSRI